MNKDLYRDLLFWGIWLLIPLLIDILSGIVSLIVILKEYFRKEKVELEYLPYITILIPVYNSEKTLANCIQSILDQNYPIKNIQVLLINNGEKNGVYDIYCKIQEQHPNLKIWWIDSNQGKSKALNKGIYAAEGKYIINIDSDGILDKNAVLRIVEKFESNTNIHAMTGVVLTDCSLINTNSNLLLRLFRRCELFEYSEAFLVGRGFQSYTDSLFTLAGAFSCFRKDVIQKTQLYNSETLGEDTHITSQIREFQNGKIALCEKAFFYVDPIDSMDKLYIQRQRWQRGEIEVASLFRKFIGGRNRNTRKVLKRTVIKDHTLVFPRLIWMFAMVYLVFIDYPLELVIMANILLYLAYVFNSALSFFVSKLYLKDQKEVKKYMNKHAYSILLLPFYRLVIFFMRVAGIINSIEKYSKWNTKTLTEEKEILSNGFKRKFSIFYRVKGWINNG
ncbi:putative glycosyltransferase, exosortase G-associated [Clostridium cavendishii DSM 21758]|uniref:Putative glycosyltransferase, exosortase G-associated n=1 Tax=Clostridium cavendishii DSM 21758 TaxID=1121302 RepID=A0A1M6JB65_9CLOT|nr:TIGR03111 family XrtG-associated glycosyltransferase [Clostridium cavendishii]SHJ43872.1 putative glycosyltransferase, exosortase G-associated [Clostridium cavendishii DSM 21758]